MSDPLLAHIQGVQDKATQLEGLMESLEFMDGGGATSSPVCPNGMSALIQISRQLTRDIQVSLDSVNLPKE